jgi:hypothetical protein
VRGRFEEGRDDRDRIGRVRRRAAAKKGQLLLAAVALQRTVSLKRAGGDETTEKAFWRFVHNARVSEIELVATARAHLDGQVAGRRVLAIQDTSEINFSRHAHSKAAFDRGGNGLDPALLIHPLLAVDADTGHVLGLADVQFIPRQPPGVAPKRARETDDKESKRWIAAAQAASGLRHAGARSVTVVADREGDIYAAYARRPPEIELLVRAQTDRGLATGGTLYAHLERLAPAYDFVLDLPALPGRRARHAPMVVRFDRVVLRKPKTKDRAIAAESTLFALDVREIEPPDPKTAIHWRLLSTSPITDRASAERAIADYRKRWQIEQLFRALKSQGLDIENSQIETPDALRRLAIVALRAAVLCLQLVHARDGADTRPATAAFSAPDVDLLAVIAPTVNGRTLRLKNPFAPRSLPWAAWIIARLGSWSGAKDDRPPGPITMHRGIQRFHDIAHGIRIANNVSTQ